MKGATFEQTIVPEAERFHKFLFHIWSSNNTHVNCCFSATVVFTMIQQWSKSNGPTVVEHFLSTNSLT